MYLALVVVWSVCGTSMVQFYVWTCKRVMGLVLQCKSRKKKCAILNLLVKVVYVIVENGFSSWCCV